MKLPIDEHKHPEKNSQNKCLEQPNKNIYTRQSFTLKNIKLKEETEKYFSLFVFKLEILLREFADLSKPCFCNSALTQTYLFKNTLKLEHC